ncbi:hypothetical protein L1987_19656 [Smallanthus sonchifolius]|uniref:Uncharacterized protein n=1 Tax=Smallanthus sonchifolius TaxID=185202 RepID=A0ACB9IQ29_9ASTR|nr:hypothetical protein L1987_19656 [Smallanthus sonchifolius]
MIPRPRTNNSDIESRILQQQSAPVNIPDCYDDDDHGNMMPPHEWIAQKLARNQISSFSVCEGAGRTLNGRDLSRVRNAVLTKTGFLE